MQSGKLRWYITIQNKVPAKSATTGEVTYTWSTFAQVWADEQPISRAGSRSAWEQVIAQQIKSQKVTQFVIRYIPGVTELMRVVDQDGNLWDIKTIINNDTRNRELWLICEFGLDVG